MELNNHRNIAAIPRSNHQEKLKQDIEIFGSNMVEDRLKAISGLDRKLCFNDPGFYLPSHRIHIFSRNQVVESLLILRRVKTAQCLDLDDETRCT